MMRHTQNDTEWKWEEEGKGPGSSFQVVVWPEAKPFPGFFSSQLLSKSPHFHSNYSSQARTSLSRLTTKHFLQSPLCHTFCPEANTHHWEIHKAGKSPLVEHKSLFYENGRTGPKKTKSENTQREAKMDSTPLLMPCHIPGAPEFLQHEGRDEYFGFDPVEGAKCPLGQGGWREG